VTFLSTKFVICSDEIFPSNTPKVEFYLSQKLTFWKNRGTIQKKKKLLIIYKFCNFLKKNISSSFIDFCCSDDKTLQKMILCPFLARRIPTACVCVVIFKHFVCSCRRGDTGKYATAYIGIGSTFLKE
jgi:hypothetical protein